jgi:ABC-type multidrug transport system ATPase subunit/ABC-type transporter Mla maintaining outer membrane lipid asymmetry permease subunit MlaE
MPVTETPAREAVLEAEGLTVAAGGRVLLAGVSFRIERGEVVLLGAPSGAGKTVLLKIIAGLITPDTPGFRIEGRLTVDGTNVLAEDGARRTRGRVGIVFQDYALLEGGTVGSNLLFALAHRASPVQGAAAREQSRALSQEFGLEPGLRVRELSGGQRQRTALARTLAFAPRILAYDEPTSGLDPANRERVARRIRSTNEEHGTTSLVVSHDLSGLLHVVDRVLLIDPETGRLESVARERALERIHTLQAPPPPVVPPPRGWQRASRTLAGFCSATTRALEGLALAVLHLVPRWPSPRWGLHFLATYLRLLAGPAALLYFAVAGCVVGFVATYFTFRFLPYRQYTEPLILDDLMGAVGFGLHRILVPLIVTILLAARAGAAIAADIGGRVAGHQVEAMHSLGAPARRYLLTGVLWAILLGVPVVAVVAYLGSRLASAAVFAVMAPDLSMHYWEQTFHRLLYEGTGWVAAKYFVSAFLVGAVAYFRGAAPKASPEDVAREITFTIVLTSLLVLVVQVVFALFEFRTL